MQISEIKSVCLHMEDLAHEVGLPRFDRVRLVADPGCPEELWFLWEETKLAVVVELDAGPEAMADALARATAGNPVLN